jgi:hypothetical protein
MIVLENRYSMLWTFLYIRVARSASDIHPAAPRARRVLLCRVVRSGRYPSPRGVRVLRPYHRAESDGIQSSFEVDSILTMLNLKNTKTARVRGGAMHSTEAATRMCEF